MSHKKLEKHESISIEHKGKTYTGTLVILGTRKLTFNVEYNGRTSSDSRFWRNTPEEKYNMRVMAHVHLTRLISEAEGW
jgi:hypothetical protein